LASIASNIGRSVLLGSALFQKSSKLSNMRCTVILQVRT
jgi:hypothetical protein